MRRQHGAYLHCAMVEILRDNGRVADPDTIAKENIRLDLWRRPSDGRHPEPWQILLRARKKSTLFDILPDRRIALRPGAEDICCR